MINEIQQTLSPSFFPTSQFGNDFSNDRFKKLQNLFDSVADAIETLLPGNRYQVSTNLGRGGIAFVPWVGIHSTKPNFDSSANNGFYLTILWKYDGSGVCLSLQKGTDGIQGGNKALQIRTAVDLIRSKYGTGGFETSINLEYHRGRPQAYEQAHISGREYRRANLSNLPNDLLQIEKLYDAVVIDDPKVLLDEGGSSGTVQSGASLTPAIDPAPEEGTHGGTWYPDEVSKETDYVEGAVTRVEVNRYERDPEARQACLDHYGAFCQICEFDFEEEFGELGRGFIHVHHVKSLSSTGGEYQVDPINDLLPVCPNCHAMLHRRHEPPLTQEQLVEVMEGGEIPSKSSLEESQEIKSATSSNLRQLGTADLLKIGDQAAKAELQRRVNQGSRSKATHNALAELKSKLGEGD